MKAAFPSFLFSLQFCIHLLHGHKLLATQVVVAKLGATVIVLMESRQSAVSPRALGYNGAGSLCCVANVDCLSSLLTPISNRSSGETWKHSDYSEKISAHRWFSNAVTPRTSVARRLHGMVAHRPLLAMRRTTAPSW